MSAHRVMVVDDDVDLRESLIEILEDDGFEAIGASNGADALKQLLETRLRPCLILLDLMMPVMDGHAFRAEQLKDPELATIPVVAISAYRDVEGQARALEVECLSKPIKIDVLRETTRRYCRPSSEG